MKPPTTTSYLACLDDTEFRKKFLIASLCGLGSVIILPGVLLLGYLAQTMQRAIKGRKGLPEWTNLGEMVALGGVALLSLVYLLPAALLVGLAVLPKLGGGQEGFFSVSLLISRFINFGALLAFVIGLMFTLAAMHTYLHQPALSSLFQFGTLVHKISSRKAELISLTVAAAVGVFALMFLTWLLSWLGTPLSFIGSTLLSLVITYNSGVILGSMEPEAEAEPALPSATPEPPQLSAPADDDDAWIPS